jgi:hypothetical protein
MSVQGDMNASPYSKSTGYASKAYAAVKEHRLGIRSLLNDDLPRVAEASSSREVFSSSSSSSSIAPAAPGRNPNDEDLFEIKPKTDAVTAREPADINVWTTWKARCKRGVEKVSRHCIDYIFYVPPKDTISTPSSVSVAAASTEGVRASAGVRAAAVLDLLSEEEVGPDFLPSCSYPSDHIAVVGELELILREGKK